MKTEIVILGPVFFFRTFQMQGVDISKNPSAGDVKVLLSLNFRLAVYLKAIQIGGSKEIEGVGEVIEYHFTKDKQDDNQIDMQINCVLCKTKIGDSLKLCGLRKSFSELRALFELPKLTGNYVLYFERVRVAVFPFDWYPCFEKDDPEDPRWKEINSTVEMLPTLSSEYANMEQVKIKIKKDQEDAQRRQKEELVRKKNEEEARKREESRKRMEELAKTLEMVSKAEQDPENFVKFMEKSLKKK